MPELLESLSYDQYDPAAGGVGLLTYDEFDRLGRAVNNATKHVAWWRIAGHIKLGDPDEHRPRSSDPMIPLPATWLAAEEISNLMGELNAWPTLEDAAKHVPDIAMLLVREVETAMAKWPLSDRPHGVKFFRCTVCQMATLRYYPPTTRGSEVVPMAVKCTAKDCHAVMDELMFMRMAAVIEAEWKAKEDARGLDSRTQRTRKNRPQSENDLQVGEGGADSYDAPEAVVVAESA